MNCEELLKNKFNNENVEILDNGILKMDSKEYTAYINLENNTVTNLSLYYPGSGGGAYGDEMIVRSTMESTQPANGMVVLSNTWKDRADCANVATEIADTLGITIQKAKVMAFSASGDGGLAAANVLAGNNINTEVYLNDTAHEMQVEHYVQPSQNYEHLVNNNVQIYAFVDEAENIEYFKQFYKRFNLNGTIVTVDTTDSTKYLREGKSHLAINDLCENDFLLDKNQNIDMSKYPSAIKHNQKTGEYEQLSQEDLERCFLTGKTYRDSGYAITLNKKNYENSNYSNSQDETTVSCTKTVIDNINNISKVTKNFDNEPVSKDVCTGLKDVAGISNLFTGISSDLNNGINNELNLIYSIAQQYYDLDTELASNVSNRLGTINNKLLQAYTSANINEITKFDKNYQLAWPLDNNRNVMLDTVSISTMKANFNDYCEREFINANEIINQISVFESDLNNKLKGEVWAKIGSRMNQYKCLQETRKNMSIQLKNAINTYLEAIEKYMNDSPPPPANCEKLDTSDLDNLKQDLINLYKLMDNAKYVINAKEYRTFDKEINKLWSKKTKTVTELVYIFNEKTRNDASRLITKYEMQIKEKEEMLTKIEGFSLIIDKSKEILDEALTQINREYGYEVDSTVTGNASSYSYQSIRVKNSRVIFGENKELDEKLEVAREKNSKMNEFYDDPEKVNRFGTYENYEAKIELDEEKSNKDKDKIYVDGTLKDTNSKDKKIYEESLENKGTEDNQKEIEQASTYNQANESTSYKSSSTPPRESSSQSKYQTIIDSKNSNSATATTESTDSLSKYTIKSKATESVQTIIIKNQEFMADI